MSVVAAQAGLLVNLLFHGVTPLQPTVDPAFKAAWRPEPAIMSERFADSDLLWREASPNGFFYLVGAWALPRPTVADPAPARRTVCAIWPKDHRLLPASIVATQALVVLNAMALEKVLWSESSRYVAFTASHADGLEAWDHPAYILDVATRKLYPVEPISGPVTAPDLAWTDDGALRVWSALRNARGGVDTTRRIQVDVPLDKVLAQTPVGPAPSWNNPFPLDPPDDAASPAPPGAAP